MMKVRTVKKWSILRKYFQISKTFTKPSVLSESETINSKNLEINFGCGNINSSQDVSDL